MKVIENISIRPTLSDSFSHGWKTMSSFFLLLLLVVIIEGMIMSPMSIGNSGPGHTSFNIENFSSDGFHFDHKEFVDFTPGFAALGILAVILGLLAMAYSLLIVPVFKFGARLMFVEAARGKRPEFETLIQGFRNNYLHIILANLLTTALIMLGFVLCIVPGIIILCRLAFVSYLVMDKKMDPIIAVEESWKMTRGHGWRIFLMGIVSFFIGILGFLCCIVGIIPAMIWVKSSFASLYVAVLKEKEEETAIDVA